MAEIHETSRHGEIPAERDDRAGNYEFTRVADNRPPPIEFGPGKRFIVEQRTGTASISGFNITIVPEGSTVVVLSDFDMKIVLPGLIAQLERKIPKPRSERSSWASIASIGVLPFLRRLANGGTDE